jgi:hypothetical protein
VDERTGKLLSLTVQAVDIDRRNKPNWRLPTARAGGISRLKAAVRESGSRSSQQRMFYSKMWRVMRGIDPNEDDRSERRHLAQPGSSGGSRACENLVRQQDTGENYSEFISNTANATATVITFGS